MICSQRGQEASGNSGTGCGAALAPAPLTQEPQPAVAAAHSPVCRDVKIASHPTAHAGAFRM